LPVAVREPSPLVRASSNCAATMLRRKFCAGRGKGAGGWVAGKAGVLLGRLTDCDVHGIYQLPRTLALLLCGAGRAGGAHHQDEEGDELLDRVGHEDDADALLGTAEAGAGTRAFKGGGGDAADVFDEKIMVRGRCGTHTINASRVVPVELSVYGELIRS
jgi:hypothetical protein